jgi:hypothetical protein
VINSLKDSPLLDLVDDLHNYTGAANSTKWRASPYGTLIVFGVD